MAEFVSSTEAEPVYFMKFTRSELRLISDIVGDMSKERCHLFYPEGNSTKPNAESLEKLNAINDAIGGIPKLFDVTSDYFDRWDDVGD